MVILSAKRFVYLLDLLCDCTVVSNDFRTQRNASLDAELERQQSEMETNQKCRAMMQFRRKLPSYQMQQAI